MKPDQQNRMKHVSAYVDQMKLFVTINKEGVKINVGVNVMN